MARTKRRLDRTGPRDGMCASHKPLFEWFPDYRIERGEHQRQCARCKRWFWPDEEGDNFVATNASDTD